MMIQSKKKTFTVTVGLVLWSCASVLAHSYSGGDGTKEDPYQIATIEDLIYLGTDQDTENKSYELVNDINLCPSEPCERVFSTAIIPTFDGTFNGDGHVIKGLTMETEDANHLGLFGELGANAIVKNVGLESVNIAGGEGSSVGAIAVTNMGYIECCYSTGLISGDIQVGGLVGENKGTIENCYSRADVFGNSVYVGGLAGYNKNGEISFCYSSGSIGSKEDEYGGIAGDNEGGVNQCYWNTTKNPHMPNNVKGEGRTEAELMDPNNYDISWKRTLWIIDKGKFPTLWVFEEPPPIQDENLLQAIIDELNKNRDPNNLIIYPTREQIRSLKELNADRRGIKSLEGLDRIFEEASQWQLTYLDLSDNNDISDIGPLSAIISLTKLKLSGNQIEDVDALSDLNSLEELWLNNNKIVDIGNICDSLSLEEMYLSGNPIGNFGPLSKLTALENLGLKNANMDDRDLGDVDWNTLENLQELDLAYNALQELSPLADLKAIIKLYLQDNRIVDVAALSGLWTLEELYLNNTVASSKGNRIEDINMLEDLMQPPNDPPEPKFHTLNLIGNPLSRGSYETLHEMYDMAWDQYKIGLLLLYSPNLDPPKGVWATKGSEPDFIRVTCKHHPNGPYAAPLWYGSYYQIYRADTPDGLREPLSVVYDNDKVIENWMPYEDGLSFDDYISEPNKPDYYFDDYISEPNKPYYYWIRAATDANGLNSTGYSKMVVGYRGTIPQLYVGHKVVDPVDEYGSLKNPYATIQEAIEAAHSGVSQEVVIKPGCYSECIDFLGKAITVRSNEPLQVTNDPTKLGCISTTIIDGNDMGPVVIFASGEDRHSILQGLTITGGRALYGAGICCDNTSPTIKNCLIMGNRAFAFGGGISCYQSRARFENCTIVGNRSDFEGGAIETFESENVSHFINCIIRGNEPDSLWVSGPNDPIVDYSVIDEHWCHLGIDNYDLDPNFINSGGWDDVNDCWQPGDYHLQSRAGRFDVEHEQWVRDMNESESSPCIDLGDPNGNYFLEPHPNGDRLNMGVYGGTPEASKSRQYEIYLFDLDVNEPNFDSTNDEPLWTFKGQWEFGPPIGLGGINDGGVGNPDPNSGFANGSNVFGVNLNGNYKTGDPTELKNKAFYLTVGPFNCQGFQGIILEFARHLNTGANVAHTVEGSYDGNDWIIIRSYVEQWDTDWVIESISLSEIDPNYDNNEFYIRWGYGYSDLWPSAASGWNIDDIAILGDPM